MDTEYLKNHYSEYMWADEEDMLAQVKVKGDRRRWKYTAKKMYEGQMHARLVGIDPISGPIKKLVPMNDVTFLER